MILGLDRAIEGMVLGGLLLQQVNTLRKSQIGGHGMKVGERVAGVNTEFLDEQDFPRERQLHVSHFPVMISDIGLLHEESSAGIEVPQDTPPESNFLLQGTVDLRDPLLFRVN